MKPLLHRPTMAFAVALLVFYFVWCSFLHRAAGCSFLLLFGELICIFITGLRCLNVGFMPSKGNLLRTQAGLIYLSSVPIKVVLLWSKPFFHLPLVASWLIFELALLQPKPDVLRQRFT